MTIQHRYRQALVLLTLLAALALFSKMVLEQLTLTDTTTALLFITIDVILVIGAYAVDSLRQRINLSIGGWFIYVLVLIWLIVATIL